MSYQMIHDAVTEAIDAVESPHGLSVGDKVLYKIQCSIKQHGGRKREKITLHEAVVDGFTDKTIRILFPNGYIKFARADQLEKISKQKKDV